MKLSKYIFRSRLAFAPIDPLDDGLREMIQREQTEPQAINLYDDDHSTRLWTEENFDDIHG